MKRFLIAALLAMPLISLSLPTEAKVRCERRDCIVVGGMEVTLKTFDAIREGSKLNILKIRRKVKNANAKVKLENIYYKNGYQVHTEKVTKSGRDAKKVKLVHWSMPFEGGAYVGVNTNCDPYFSNCNTTVIDCSSGLLECNSDLRGGITDGTRWVGFDGKWDGVCAKATVTVNGETDKLFSKAGKIPSYVTCENK